MNVCILASGSAGNAIYVESRRARLLIDAGLSGTDLARRLAQIGRTFDELDGVIITHEHTDHIKGLRPIARRRIPLYLNRSTYAAMTGPQWESSLRSALPLEAIRWVENGHSFTIHDLVCSPFTVSHDAADPFGLAITDGRVRVGIATDLGFVSGLVLERLKHAHLLILEANHDEAMLKNGRYPWPVKQRILGQYGHLSNGAAATAIEHLVHADIQEVILAHLSQENNRPDLAIEAASEALDRAGRLQMPVSAAEQHRVGVMREL